MTTDVSTRSLRSAIATIALVSASLLALQVLLTRVCALRLHFHFGFLIISNSLLGIGASGSLLALFERSWRLLPENWIRRLLLGYLVSLPLSWLWVVNAPIPDTLTFDSVGQTAQFIGFNLACAVPFFFGGAVVGLILSVHASRVHVVYAADLLGAGVGCVLVPYLLWDFGAGGCFLLTIVLAMAACAAAAELGPIARTLLVLFTAGASLWMPSFDRQFPVPGKKFLDVTKQDNLQTYGRSIYSRWSANSRIDVLPLPEGQHFLQARGRKALTLPLPRQWWIAQDGDAGTMLSDFGREPEKLEMLKQTTYSASFALKAGTKPRVCVIGVGGATDLWAAKVNDPASIRGIELNQGVIDVHRTIAREFSAPLLDDPRVEIVCDEGRSALMRSDERFDVIQLTGIDTWTALNSGAYVLAENYLYTVEACRTMIDRLAEHGILQITRMAAGMETIRLMNNLWHALPEGDRGAFTSMVAALRTDDYLISVLLKKGGFTAEESQRLQKFCADADIDAVVLPDGGTLERLEQIKGRLEAANVEVARLDNEIGVRNESVDAKKLEELREQRRIAATPIESLQTRKEICEFVLTGDKQGFVDSYPFDITPTTDDKPYFFKFLRWDDPQKAKEWLHQPTSLTQGNPVFLRNQLLFSLAAAALFILVPLLFRRGSGSGGRRGALRFFVYFAGLGVGFIGIEIALIQKFTLLLGQPLYSIVVTLSSVLVFTGVGAWLSHGLLNWEPQRGRYVPLAIFIAIALLAFLSPSIVSLCVGLPLVGRILVVVAITAPIGMLLGMPFAHGIRIVERVNPGFVPWAWAVNGSTTVVGSILTVILSMNYGFAAVLFAAGVVYLIAFAAIDTLARSEAPAESPEVAEAPAEAVSL